MKRYSEYKDSGVKWIGEIPGHWECTRIKFIANLYGRIGFRGYNSKDLNKDGIGAITLSPSNMKDMMMDYTNVTYLSWEKYNESPEIMIQQGDILFVKTGSSYGKSCYVDNLPQEATINPQILRINPLINGRFLCYYFNSSLARTFTECGVVGGTIPTISQEKVGNFIALNPPLPEQEAIVTYLDTKVAKIDEYISIAEKKIAALEELKQTIIAEAVTRGIHKEVPMKDSGVKWIGMIPEHWKVLCLKYLSKIKGRIGYRGYTAADLVSEGEGAFVIGGKHINQCILNTESPDYISWDKYYESPEIMVSKGDIVMAQRGSLGKVALIDKEINEATINPSLVLIKDICCDASFLYFYLRSNSTLTLIELLNTATAVPMISQKQIEKMPIPLPPLPEQQEIVTYIEAKVANINQLCQAERSQIEKLKEYKQRLISDVVTGKVKVTND